MFDDPEMRESLRKGQKFSTCGSGRDKLFKQDEGLVKSTFENQDFYSEGNGDLIDSFKQKKNMIKPCPWKKHFDCTVRNGLYIGHSSVEEAEL